MPTRCRRYAMLEVCTVLLAAALLLPAPGARAASSSIFMNLLPVEGDVANKDYRNWIDVDQLSLSITSEVQDGKAGASDRPLLTVSDLMWEQALDRSAPGLLQAIGAGTLFPTVDVHFVFDGFAGSEKVTRYFTMQFSNVRLTRVDLDLASDRASQTLAGAFSFTRIALDYYSQDIRGAFVKDTSGSLDLETGKTTGASIATVFALGLAGPSTTVVPLPAGAWLLGSGLLLLR
ncbi:MAG: type VI secretion system tube protein Hcp, partial [Gammaproteobacteria bacterium]